MITIEISDESILFTMCFLLVAFVVALFIVQWDMTRTAKKRRARSEEQ